VTLTFDLLTSKSNQFISVVSCTQVVNLMNFPQAICKICLPNWPYLDSLWPWPFTFWPQNLISSSLPRDAPNLYILEYDHTHGRTDGQTSRKHKAVGANRRRRQNGRHEHAMTLSSVRNYAAVRPIRPFRVIQGHRFWYQSKPIWDFLLVINSNLAPILHCFRDIALERSKIAIFGYPSSV